MLAIVVPFGAIILGNGASQINAFNNSMSNTIEHRNNGVQEDLVFEHIRFEPSTNLVTISLMNIGSVETIVDKITLVNMTSQEILYKIDSLSAFNPLIVSIGNSTDITIDADLGVGGKWSDGPSPTNFEYRVSIITSRDNFFDTVARPYNTWLIQFLAADEEYLK